jgi:hypothetical protein
MDWLVIGLLVEMLMILVEMQIMAANGATLTTDRFGEANKAYYFDGTSFIDCGSSDQMAMTNNLTLSCWGKTSLQSPNLCIAGRWSNAFNPPPFGTPEYCISFNNTNVSSCIVISTPPNEYVSAPITYYDNQWHQFTMTYDGSINKIFIDGNLASQGNFSGNIQSFVNKFVVGTYGLAGFPDLPNSWIGEIDDVGLWNRALTPTEITSLYQAEVSCQSLVINSGTLSSFNPPVYQSTVTIYPNPANDQITIDCGTLANVVGYHIEIVNTLGQVVFNQPMNTQQYNVPLNTWSGTGVYFVKIYDASNNLLNTKKIILQ